MLSGSVVVTRSLGSAEGRSVDGRGAGGSDDEDEGARPAGFPKPTGGLVACPLRTHGTLLRLGGDSVEAGKPLTLHNIHPYAQYEMLSSRRPIHTYIYTFIHLFVHAVPDSRYWILAF